MPVPGKITSGVKIKDHKRKTSIMGRDDSTRKCSAVVSRLTDRNPRDRQNATVWRHSSKLNPSAERFLDCACLFVSVRGMFGGGGGDDKGILDELLSVPEPPFDENKKKQQLKSNSKLEVCLPCTLSPADTDLHLEWIVLVNAFGGEFMVC